MKRAALAKFYLSYRLYIFPAIVILASLILIVLVIYPQTVKLISNTGIEKDLKARSQLLETKAAELDSLDGSDLSSKVSEVLFSYPVEKDYPAVISLLQQLTSQSNFSIDSLSFGSGGSGKFADAQSYSVKLEVSGTVNSFDELISQIELSPRIMSVETLDISPNRSSGGISAVLGINVLYASLPQTFGTVDSPLPKLSVQDEQLIAKLVQTASAIGSGFSQNVVLSPRGKSNPFE